MSHAVCRLLMAVSVVLFGQATRAAEPPAARPQLPLRLAAPVRPKQLPLSPPSPPFRYTEATHGAGSLKYVGEIPVFTLQGTPEQIGEQTAVLAKEVLPPLLETPKRIIQQFGLNYDLLRPIATAAATSMIGHSPERFRAEMDSLAKYTNADASLLYVANSLTELRRIGGCSAFLVTPDRTATGEMMFGRNFDFPTFGVLDRYSCVMIVRPEGKHAFASIAVPGLTGVISGMNDAGLALATLDVYASRDGSSMFDMNGAPLALTYRQMLEECETVEEARALLEKTPRTTWMNLACCDRNRAVIFEITPKKVGVRDPEGDILRCTNHFMLPDLAVGVRCERFKTLGHLVDFKAGEKFTLEEVHRCMHSVHQSELTFQTMIFEPASLKVHVAFGPGPCTQKPLQVIELADRFAGK
ncbi:Acyl-coenzyme A:6-aminopenicillanic acid acyl-transferase [Caulifigura coniformis]|uniref:Acyl-coenzyme A:6-aminopenicillanic acid acyl-transferase n=2 Tax=Caulifigura coniformis TaxID=2527983 RepID=A0A517SB60_9PLAN|nr:Acyl-coenzyme A:6-aminopenicillanic acid acyl-transferase [Caulifigura coniformis]